MMKNSVKVNEDSLSRRMITHLNNLYFINFFFILFEVKMGNTLPL